MILLAYWRATWKFIRRLHRLPNLVFPSSYNDKVFWRKFLDHNPDWRVFNDKLQVRDRVAETCPDLPSAPILWSGSDPAAIPDTVLAAPALIKTNHGSGYNIFYDGHSPTRPEIETQLTAWLSETFGTWMGEWGYWHIRPQILIEARLTTRNGGPPANINVHACDGKVVFVGVYLGSKDTSRQLSFFTSDGQRLPFTTKGGTPPIDPGWIPGGDFHRAVEAACRLSRGVDYLRCDFMAADGVIYFNELTTYPGSGCLRFSDPDAVSLLMKEWDIRKSWFLRTPQSGWREVWRRALSRRLAARSQ
ncbi:ATP-grasp fold amidoligase family protein [Shimia biformata]|uniref:ATP-grasp fold amidoligase family protein n=1 Tax=Shimia biformata TaxID=1294299 RepID=UPI001951BF0D|nr:ATP-grasp fold amidoligase family protein [Shimia biformata]